MIRLAAAALALLSISLGAQAPPADPHLQPPQVPDVEYTLIDDQLIPVELLDREVWRRQAALVDVRTANGYWDFGVVPYQIADGFTSAERDRISAAMAGWMSVAPVQFVPRTTEVGYLNITKDDGDGRASACFSSVGQFRRGMAVRTNLGGNCAGSLRTVYHEL